MSARRTLPILFGALFLATLATAALAQSVPPAAMPPEPAERREALLAPPLRLAETVSRLPLVALSSAREGAKSQLEDLARWNREGHRPTRSGFARPLPAAQRVSLSAAQRGLPQPLSHGGGFVASAAAGDLVWGPSVGVGGSYRLRLHLSAVDLPAGTRFWVYAAGGDPRPFGLELLGPDRSLWTPSVLGDSIFLEVQVPAEALAKGQPAKLEIREVLESFRLDAHGQPMVAGTAVSGAAAPAAQSCLIDASCATCHTLDVIADLRKAVALLDFIDQGQEFLCSGGLLKDSLPGSFIPYLLTANHCISTQIVATTLEAFWDDRTSSCGGAAPDLGTLPRSNGSTLLATGSADSTSDYTLLQLHGVPDGRFFLGWDASPGAVANGARLHRISHPNADPQGYSESTVRTSGVAFCSDAPRPNFIYAQLTRGATFGGSSGAPSVLSGGFVVGQLLGGCGPDPENGCDYSNSELDGSFAVSYPALAKWLAPEVPSVCNPGPTTLCLAGGRFRVEATWRTPCGAAGNAQVVKLSDGSGYFWFFDPSNIEEVVKVIDACGTFNHFWVFAGGLTNVQTTLTVTDTSNGKFKTYTNAQGTPFRPIQDTSAFATCP